jgi:hypothetical protein
VNQGGEPAHDDYGLPPVDIEIPDDARELDRDVQAYHRELRALRRHERSNRWRAPLRRSSMIVPLMAGCLILAMVAGMVLTMFSANPYFSEPGRQRLPGAGSRNTAPSTGPASASSAPRSASAGISSGIGTIQTSRLPAGNISVAGQPVALRRLSGLALAIVPVNCGCAAAINRLLVQARQAQVEVYLVGSQGVKLSNLARASAPGTVVLASDAHNVLSRAYKQAGLVVVLVDTHHHARVEPALKAGFSLEQELRALRPAH